jgi:hypothetical protein
MNNYDMFLDLIWAACWIFASIGLVVQFAPKKIYVMLGEKNHDRIVDICMAAAVLFFMVWAIFTGLDYFVFSQ